MKEYTPGHFVAAIRDVRFETPRMQHAQTVFLAMSPREQAAVTRACSGLRNISGVGMVTAFEIMVATVQAIPVDDRKNS
jgi:hypothetical protein